MSDALDTLEVALPGTAHWTWWTAEPPDFIQLEFIATRIWNEPKEGETTPSGQFALAFGGVKAIIFLSRAGSDEKEVPSDWHLLLQKDMLEMFMVAEGEFTLTSPEKARAMLASASSVVPFFGTTESVEKLARGDCFLAFWAGPIGAIVVAQYLVLFNHKGKVPIAEVPDRAEKWQQYFEQYKKRRDTPDAMVFDVAPEILIAGQ
ncbi:MAG: hypothetical protein WC712_02925 [Candidatus Brocadiia bacterium]